MKMQHKWTCLISIALLLLVGCATTDTYKMKMKDDVTIQKSERLIGYVQLAHFRNGALIETREYKNLIVNTGKACTASRLNGDGAEAVFNYVAIGTGATAEAVGQTALVAEITSGGGQRAIAAVSRTTAIVTNDTARWIITYNFTSSFVVTESGIFNAASAGCMLARKVFASMTVDSGDSIIIRWRVHVR